MLPLHVIVVCIALFLAYKEKDSDNKLVLRAYEAITALAAISAFIPEKSYFALILFAFGGFQVIIKTLEISESTGKLRKLAGILLGFALIGAGMFVMITTNDSDSTPSEFLSVPTEEGME
ncbi:MAG: hypothetical protein MJZ23_09060 [Paludibacteraceae bacterium]|nr:hypothetical protein [Paludibacteraceae bacterium]